MARKPPAPYNVFKHDGAQIITGVPLALARSEAARLNAESRVVIAQHPAVTDPETGATMFPAWTEYAGMVSGEVSRYEVRSITGLVVK